MGLTLFTDDNYYIFTDLIYILLAIVTGLFQSTSAIDDLHQPMHNYRYS